MVTRFDVIKGMTKSDEYDEDTHEPDLLSTGICE